MDSHAPLFSPNLIVTNDQQLRISLEAVDLTSQGSLLFIFFFSFRGFTSLPYAPL